MYVSTVTGVIEYTAEEPEKKTIFGFRDTRKNDDDYSSDED